MAAWENPDVELLYDVNGLAERAPEWADLTMELVGEYGTVFAVMLLGLWSWWSARRGPDRDTAVSAVAGLLWAPLAAAVALLINFPIRNLVERPRPFLDHQGLEVLVDGKTDYSFVSDHATLTMAVAVGVFLVSRKVGLLCIATAVFAGFSRVYMGVHYPTDVIGGLALGTAVALLLAPVALWLLTPLTRSLADTRAGWLVWAGPGRRSGSQTAGGDTPETAGTAAGSGYRRDLAA